MTKVWAQIVGRQNTLRLLNIFSSLIINQAVSTSIRSALEAQAEGEPLLARWSTIHSSSKSTLSARYWSTEGNLISVSGSSGTSMEKSSYSKRATWGHRVSSIKLTRIILTTCSPILQIMQSKRQAKIMEPSKMVIRSAMQPSRSTASHRQKTFDWRATQ